MSKVDIPRRFHRAVGALLVVAAMGSLELTRAARAGSPAVGPAVTRIVTSIQEGEENTPVPPVAIDSEYDRPTRRDLGILGFTYQVLAARQAALNTELYKNGFSEVGLAWPMFGFSLDFSLGRVRFDLGLAGGPSQTVRRSRDGAEASLRPILVDFDVGYEVYVDRAFSIYPITGLAVGGLSARFDPHHSPLAPATLAKYSYKDEVAIESSSFALNLGVGFTSFVAFANPRHPHPFWGTPGLALDVRIGYLWHFSHQAWQESEGDKQRILGLPTIDLSGVYTRLEIGFASAEERYRSCSAVCPEVPHAESTCRGTLCNFACVSGFGDCDGSTTNGCERHLDTLQDCGRCGQRCVLDHGLGTCATGECEIAECDAGFMNCDGRSGTGCETDVRSNPRHCGRCGTRCAASETCEDGRCR